MAKDKGIIKYWQFWLIVVVLFVVAVGLPPLNLLIPDWLIILSAWLFLTAGKPLFKKTTTSDYVLSPIFILIGIILIISFIANAFIGLSIWKLFLITLVTAIGSQVSYYINLAIPKKRFSQKIVSQKVKKDVDFGDIVAGFIILSLSFLIVGNITGLLIGSVFALIMSIIPPIGGRLIWLRAIIIFIIGAMIKFISNFLGGFFG